MEHIIKIGTRGSKLALWQAHHIADLLAAAGIGSQIVIIETKGDKILNTSLAKIGSKGVFTEELEEQLRSKTIDIAVHSAKDMQASLPNDLEIIAFTQREKPNDVLVCLKDISLQTSGAAIGTSSVRRVAMLRHYFPHLRTTDMRGNLQTRMQKLSDNQADALLLAYAGVHRMQMEQYIVHHFPTEQFTPAVGQGTVAVEASTSLSEDLRKKIRVAINDTTTEICLKAERAYLKRLQGGCSIPSFGLATIEGQKVRLNAGLIGVDGKQIIRYTAEAPYDEADNLGTQIGEKVLVNGGESLLKEIREQL